MAKMYAAVLPEALNCEADVFDTDTIFIQGEAAFFLIRKADRPANIHIAFHMEEHEGVKKAFDLAMAAGFKDNGKPGYRLDYAPNYYAAFVHDCDGNNVEFLCRKYSASE